MANSVVSRMIACFAGYNKVEETANAIAVLQGGKGKALLDTGMGRKAIFGAFDALPKDHPTAPFWGAVRAALEAGPTTPASNAGLGDIPLPNAKVGKASLKDALKDTDPKVAKKATKKAKAKAAKSSKRPKAVVNPASNAPFEVRKAVHTVVTLTHKGAAYKAEYNKMLVAAGFQPHYA